MSTKTRAGSEQLGKNPSGVVQMGSPMFRSRKILFCLALLGIFSALCLWIYPNLTIKPPRTLRVGVDQSPPFYEIQRDGSVRGLAIDVLNEAARRRGIRLIWMPLKDIPLDTALATHMVDLWPLV